MNYKEFSQTPEFQRLNAEVRKHSQEIARNNDVDKRTKAIARILTHIKNRVNLHPTFTLYVTTDHNINIANIPPMEEP